MISHLKNYDMVQISQNIQSYYYYIFGAYRAFTRLTFCSTISIYTVFPDFKVYFIWVQKWKEKKVNQETNGEM